MSNVSIIGAYNTKFGAFVEKNRDTGEVTDALVELIKFPLALTSLGRTARLRFEAEGRPTHLAQAILDLAATWT